MDNQTKVIVGLLVLILILACVFGLKLTGVIKPSEKNQTTEELTNKLENVEIEQENKIDKQEIIYRKNTTENNSSRKMDFDIRETIMRYNAFVIKYGIVIFVIMMALNIGIAKMYSKIGMPTWAIILQVISPFLSLINISILTSIINILNFASAIILFKLLDAFSIELGENKKIFIGVSSIVLIIILIISKFNIIFAATSMVSLFVVVLIVMFHIKMCLNLGESFNKSKGFKLGLILLPGIFQAILGYQKN